jgi:DNA invertase Pin-like site-specific DNA recombinase
VGDLIGYARVSTTEQNPTLQLDALQAADCERVFTEEASGAVAQRPELTRALDPCGPATRWSYGSSLRSGAACGT